MKKTIKLIIFFLVLASCENQKEPVYEEQPTVGGVTLYKIKDTSYFDYVPVMVNKDASEITAELGTIGYPEFRKCKPAKLENNYYYEPFAIKKGKGCFFTFGEERTAVATVKLKDYLSLTTIRLDQILSADLFDVYYKEKEPYHTNDSTTFEEDTALVNSWIRKGELDKYMERIK